MWSCGRGCEDAGAADFGCGEGVWTTTLFCADAAGVEGCRFFDDFEKKRFMSYTDLTDTTRVAFVNVNE